MFDKDILKAAIVDNKPLLIAGSITDTNKIITASKAAMKNNCTAEKAVEFAQKLERQIGIMEGKTSLWNYFKMKSTSASAYTQAQSLYSYAIGKGHEAAIKQKDDLMRQAGMK